MLAKVWRAFEFILMGIGLFAVPFLWMSIQDNRLRSAVEPPWRIRTLDDFRNWRPQYEQAVRLESAGSVYYLVFGERARVLASGPSGYLFDARGHLVGWIRDTGDDNYLRVAADSTARKESLSVRRIVPEPGAAGEGKK